MPDEKMSKEDWISAKIKKLIGEGKDPKQAAAIAHSMWERRGKKKALDGDESDDLTLDEKYFERLAQREVGYVTLSTKASAACANCRWFKPATGWEDGRVDSCHLIDNYPDEIMPTGWCDRHEVKQPVPPPQMTPMPVVIVEPDTMEAKEKALIDRIWDGIHARLNPAPQPQMGFTVYKDASGAPRWLALYSNNFEDREGEIFSEKGFDRYVARLDMGVVPMPRLRSWHVPGSEYGTADWVDRIGHFFAATGTYDDTDAGRAGAAYDEQHWKEYGVSHGLLYRASDKQVVGGRAVYTDWNTFEISPLPYRRAANDLTAFAVDVAQEDALKEAEMDQEKRKHLVDKFGEDYVAKLETLTEQRGKAMETLRAYKDFVHPEGENAEVEANKEALDTANEAFKDLFPALVEDTGEAVSASVKAVEAVQQQTKDFEAFKAELEKRFAELIKDIEAGTPRRSVRASKDLRTRLSDDDPAAKLVEKSIEQERLEGGALAGMFKNGKHEE